MTVTAITTCAAPYIVGGAQFGQAYGVMNRTGVPGPSMVVRMLEAAASGGAWRIDTAAAYGESESVIGRALASSDALRHAFTVTTKLDPLDRAVEMEDGVLATAIERSVQRSMERLRLDHLPVLLLHSPGLVDFRGGMVLDILSRLVEHGDVGRLGVSVDLPEEAHVALGDGRIRVLELPLNPLNVAHLRSGILDRCKKQGVEVVARSVFLQGLLAARPPMEGRWPAQLSPRLQRFHDRAEELGMTGAALALAWGRTQETISGWVIGAETDQQVSSNVALFSNAPLSQAAASRLVQEFSDIPRHLAFPAYWSTPHA